MRKLFKKNWIFKLALKAIANKIVRYPTQLTPEYLKAKGWVQDEWGWVEPNIKDRDRITITFQDHYYRVWHSEKRTFIALESSVEWFEAYYLIIHGNNGRFELSGI